MASAYVHIPYCRSKCRYCGFNSVPLQDDQALESYCGALVAEISSWDADAGPLDTLYFGGGTPSILGPRQLERIMAALAARVGTAPGAELTIEANPETLDPAKLAALRALGFNRLSLGAQSFDDRSLRLMGRPHDADCTARACRAARAAGFDNIGIDLIFALPGQTPADAQRDLDQLLQLAPEHCSLYALTWEPQSEFGKMRSAGALVPVSEDAEAEMYLAAIERMAAAGLAHYEVSNFARPGRESRHNLNYWRCGDYRGCGAGAHSHRAGQRWGNEADPAAYVRKLQAGASPVAFEETLSRAQRLFEAVFLGLRMTAGIDAAAFQRQWGIAPLDYQPAVWGRLQSQGMVDISGGSVKLTQRGLLLADRVLAELAPEHEEQYDKER